ncbi:hypothetical protein [Corynebacterium flavescens]|uniref:hypothetical protein n=1 Tax=Corynebacterium flavescens TaxID=28028 RepID=UPI003FD2D43F
MNNKGSSFNLYHYPLLAVPFVEIGLVVASAMIFPRLPWLLIASLLGVGFSAALGIGKISTNWPELASIIIGVVFGLLVLYVGQHSAILIGFLWPLALALLVSGVLTLLRKLVARLRRTSNEKWI